ncbi:MAG TPA: hypothetical protein VGH87_27360 [Polyangiaceae bacterium]|jgi:hypothetical protein
MRSLVKIGVSVVIAGLGALACSQSTQPTQGIVASNVQGAAGGSGCSSPEQFIYLPENASVPGPDTNDPNNIVITGTADDMLTCSVIPNGANFDLSIIAQITGGSAPGTLHVAGSVQPRQRDGSGNPTTAGDAVQMPGLTVDFLDPTKHLTEKDCFAQYTLTDGIGNPGVSLPGPADTKVNADGNAGAVWLSVFCPKLVNETTGKSGLDGCLGTATFRIENCTTK